MYVLFDKFSLYSQSQKKNNILALTDNVMADNKNQDVAYFLSFCIEQYKNEKGLSGYAAMELFSRYNVLDYLAEHFDVLHTQNSRWILEDIDEFIRTRQSNE